jgi:hypothetical protein
MHNQGALHKGRNHSWLRTFGACAVLATLVFHLSWHIASYSAVALQMRHGRRSAQGVSAGMVKYPPVASRRHHGRFARIPEMRESNFVAPFGLPPVIARPHAIAAEVPTVGMVAVAPRGRAPPSSELVAS